MTVSIKTGDIVEVDLNPTQGDEINKVRPCLILEGFGHPGLDLVLVAPITSSNLNNKTEGVFVPIGGRCGLSKPSAVNIYQMRCIATSRISKKLGHIGAKDFDKIKSRLAIILGISEKHLKL